MAAVGSVALRSLWADQFTCDHLITGRVGAPSLFCNGFDPVPDIAGGTVDAVTGLFGDDDGADTRVDGLETYVDGPLNGVRQAIVWGGLSLAVALSAAAVFIWNRMAAVAAFLRLDHVVWTRVADSATKFAFVFAGVTVAGWLLLA